jgi:hypothetical protein
MLVVDVGVRLGESVRVGDGVGVCSNTLVDVGVSEAGEVAVGSSASVAVTVGVTVVVAVIVIVAIGVEVAVGRTLGASNAPMSHVAIPLASPSYGRVKPRWSVEGHPAFVPASMAGLEVFKA